MRAKKKGDACRPTPSTRYNTEYQTPEGLLHTRFMPPGVKWRHVEIQRTETAAVC